MFRIKICGITSVDDGCMAADAGADAVGLNFFASSPRAISAALASRIAAALPPAVAKVGLFVNAQPAHVRMIAERLPLDLVQLHGDESPEALAELADLPLMKAFRLGAEGLEPVERFLARCQQLGVGFRAVLLDAHVAGQFGGTGVKVDWTLAQQFVGKPAAPPTVLAGGLTPSNVAQAIVAVGPRAVDTASGVELSPGKKDAAAVQRFVAQARAAFDEIAPR